MAVTREAESERDKVRWEAEREREKCRKKERRREKKYKRRREAKRQMGVASPRIFKCLAFSAARD